MFPALRIWSMGCKVAIAVLFRLACVKSSNCSLANRSSLHQAKIWKFEWYESTKKDFMIKTFKEDDNERHPRKRSGQWESWQKEILECFKEKENIKINNPTKMYALLECETSEDERVFRLSPVRLTRKPLPLPGLNCNLVQPPLEVNWAELRAGYFPGELSEQNFCARLDWLNSKVKQNP